MNTEIFITLSFVADILLAAIVIASLSTLHHLDKKVAAMALDFTAVQSSLSTLTDTVTAVSTTVSTLEASSGTAADQSTLDGVTSSLNGLNTVLGGLVSTVSQ